MRNLAAPPERQAHIRLRDGRALALSEWGPPDGRPVVFCTGAGMSGSLGFGADELPRLGVRLLAVDRPGLGASDPDPGKTLDSWAADIQQLVAAQRLRAVTAVGFSQGAPFAYALAGRGMVGALAIVSGQDELAHPRIRPLLHPDVERMVADAQRDAVAFEQRFGSIATAEVLWQLIIGMSGERDRTLYTDDMFGAAYERALREGFARGAVGYARDLRNALGDWPVAPEDITVPVDLWYGALDTSTVHSPDLGVTMASRLPRASHTVDPDEGGSILWTRSRDILAKLLGHLAP